MTSTDFTSTASTADTGWKRSLGPVGFIDTHSADQPLSVNTDDSRHYRVVGKSRGDGEKDLRTLVQNSSIEEAWIYVEGVDQSGKTIRIWYEVGENQREDRLDLSGYFVGVVVREDLQRFGVLPRHVSSYHFHPDHVGQSLVWTMMGNPRVEEWTNTFSYKDLMGAFDDSRTLGEWGLESFDERVVVPQGIWRLTPQRDFQDRTTPMEIFSDVAKYAMYRDGCGRASTLPGHIPIIGPFFPRKHCAPSEIIRNFSNGNVTIEFMPAR